MKTSTSVSHAREMGHVGAVLTHLGNLGAVYSTHQNTNIPLVEFLHSLDPKRTAATSDLWPLNAVPLAGPLREEKHI